MSHPIPGNLGPSGTVPVQAAVVVSHSLDNLLRERKETAGPVLGTAVYAESVELYEGEVAAFDRTTAQQGCMPASFTSLTGIDVDRSRGQHAFNRRFAFAGIVVTARDFRAASGLYDPNVTLQIHGLISMRWRSPEAYNPIPGDWVVMYCPSIDDAERSRQLDYVVGNSSGAKYAEEIHVGHRIPFLTKVMNLSDVLLLPQAAMTEFCSDPTKYGAVLLQSEWDRSVPLAPEVEVMLNILGTIPRMMVLGGALMKNQTAKLDDMIETFVFTNAEFAVSPEAKELVRRVGAGDDEGKRQMGAIMGDMMRTQFATFFQVMQYVHSSIIGKVAGPRLSDFIQVVM